MEFYSSALVLMFILGSTRSLSISTELEILTDCEETTILYGSCAENITKLEETHNMLIKVLHKERRRSADFLKRNSEKKSYIFHLRKQIRFFKKKSKKLEGEIDEIIDYYTNSTSDYQSYADFEINWGWNQGKFTFLKLAVLISSIKSRSFTVFCRTQIHSNPRLILFQTFVRVRR